MSSFALICALKDPERVGRGASPFYCGVKDLDPSWIRWSSRRRKRDDNFSDSPFLPAATADWLCSKSESTSARRLSIDECRSILIPAYSMRALAGDVVSRASVLAVLEIPPPRRWFPASSSARHRLSETGHCFHKVKHTAV